MLRKLLFAFLVAMIGSQTSFAQVGQGTIKGTITDGESGEPVPFANVVAYSGSNQVLGTTTDFDGKFTLKPLDPGNYDIQVSSVGFQTKRITDVAVSSDRITRQNFKITQGVKLKEVEIIEYKKPLIEIDKTTTETTMNRDDINKMAVRTVNNISKTTGNGVFSRDDGSNTLNVRGQRGNSNVTFIDGVKVIGSTNLPQSAIEEVTVKTGGLSAQYGDATGAVRTITTRGGFKEYFGSVEVLSSGFRDGDDVIGLDDHGFNLFGFAVGGPILTKKDEDGNVKESSLSFLLSGEFRSDLVGGRPLATTLVKPKDGVEREIRENPYIFDEVNDALLKRAEFLTLDDFEEIDFQRNSDRKTFVMNGKFDVKISDLSSLAFGGTVNHVYGNNYSRAFSLFNYENNSESETTDFRLWGRYTQRFANAEQEEGEEDQSLIKNAFFSVQADFSRRSGFTQDEQHQENFFDYGYVGRFERNTRLSFDDGVATLNDGRTYRGQFLTAFDAPVSLDFTPGDKNPVLANYTSNFYDFIPEGDQRRTTINEVEGNGGLVNGSVVNGNIYNMWTAAGAASNGFSKFENDQIRFSGRGSADIGDHAIMLGFEYEQRIQRAYSFNPRDLWDLGRNTVNTHISQIDSNNFSVNFRHPNPINPTVTFERRFSEDQRSFFAYNVRRALGFDPNGTSFIDFDSYDPSLYNISFFAADQLMNPANNINMFTRGFSTTGKKLSTSTTLDDFFNETNELGFKTRPVAPYEPIYMAGYIEDKFAFDDLIFRLGLRLDRFDANQPVLKDRFSFFPTRNVAFAKSTDPNQGTAEAFTAPANIGDDFVVYVDDIESPSIDGIIGYRDPATNRFFGSTGEELNDPTVLQSGTRIAPWLENPGDITTTRDLNSESFEDYDPQFNLMPRISFSFPISDEATFFANYDIKTQRPGGQNILNPIDLIFIANLRAPNDIVNNPNLEPTKTISYEIGFKQKLSNSSALTISANYNEQRDEIQVRNLVGAFPQDYLTYDNIDFGTIKGFSVNYDLRRVKNFSLRVNYTLQFAEGTGSNALSTRTLVTSNQPNLRSIFPFTFDQRHQIITTFDYRYGAGRRYNGPKVNGKNILENTGLNVVFIAGSGTPFTARSLAGSNEFLTGSQTVQPVSGDINGSRLPWTMRVDARLDKSFTIKWGNKSEANEALWKEGKKQSVLSVYLQVLNVLDRKNVRGVYGFTGNPDDDGFLNAPQFQDQIRGQVSEQSFRDLYTLRLRNPNNFELPRRIRLGAQLSF